jgi:hypothetical protein
MRHLGIRAMTSWLGIRVPLRHITLRNMLCHLDILPWETCCVTQTYYPEKHVVPLRHITLRNMLCHSDILPWETCATQTYYLEKHVVPLRHITLRNMLCHSDILPWETCCATQTYYPDSKHTSHCSFNYHSCWKMLCIAFMLFIELRTLSVEEWLACWPGSW